MLNWNDIYVFQDDTSTEQEHDLRSDGQVCSHDLDQLSHDPGLASHDSQSDTEKVGFVG